MVRQLLVRACFAVCVVLVAITAVQFVPGASIRASMTIERSAQPPLPSHWSWPGEGNPPSVQKVHELVAEQFTSEGYGEGAAVVIAEHVLRRAVGQSPELPQIDAEQFPESDEYLTPRAHAAALLIRHFRENGLGAHDAGQAAGASLAGVAQHYGTSAYQAGSEPPCETRLVFLRYCDEHHQTRRHVTFMINDLWVYLSQSCPLPDPVPLCEFPSVWWLKFNMPSQYDVIPSGARVHIEVPDDAVYVIPCDDDLIKWNCFGLTPQDPVDRQDFEYDCCPSPNGCESPCLE